ncbi:MAG: RC-LH1 core complex protein PufX [Rhodobacteraceae bacterium]|nr:RC-LH1 core complex protein PufX [Paracoccaceae bacterium]
MSEKNDWWMRDEKMSLRGWVTTHMLRGAGAAAMLFFGIILFIVILRMIAGILPENPYASLELGQEVLRTFT